MALLDVLHDREKLMKLMMIGFISSLVFIVIGVIVILQDLLG